eukprot:GFKZ01002582.1.p1 GENE.GFKZ01002582.1~~GFKZ01002582.1.p1  ORF type:complete len:748 (-),score=122.75 GFKZ01002582.1:493-2736(-)
MDIDLMVLQERCRRDPLSYHDDFLSQRRHFDALLCSTSLRPSAPAPRLVEVASFIGSVAHCYVSATTNVARPISDLLTQSGVVMHPDTRRALVKLLALLQTRGAADPAAVIPLFFRLLACNDKNLRRMLHAFIVSDIKKLHARGHGSRGQVQAFLFGMVDDPNEVLVKRSLHVLIDLFRKRIWNNSKCANMISKACFHPSMPVALIAAKFILDAESKDADLQSDDEDEEDRNLSRYAKDGQKASELWKAYNMTGKKSTKQRKNMERIITRITRVKSSKNTGPVAECKPGHPALQAMMLLNDPQEFTENLFRDLQGRRRKECYENRLVLVNLISRLVGTHELILFNFYSFLQRYLQPAQPEVTRVLAYLTQACHDRVPSDVLHPILRGLADNFVSERSSPAAVAAGINTIRAICSRVPLAILDDVNEYKAKEDQEAPLLEDLVQYKSSKDKGVMMAARSLLALYREVNPQLLHKKDRGRSGAEMVQRGVGGSARAYGEMKYATGVEGAELLKERAPGEDDSSDGDEANERNGDYDDESNTIKENARPVVSGAKEIGDIESNEESGSEKDAADTIKEIDKDQDEITSEHDEEEPEDEVNREGLSPTLHPAVRDMDYEGKAKLEVERRMEETEIFSNEDFARIRELRAAKTIGVNVLTPNTGSAVDPEDLQGPLKRERRTLAERLESVKEGREGRKKFGSRKGLNKGGGSTNKRKLKTKSNSMVIHKRRKRSKMSRRDKQISMRKKKDYR